MKLISIFWILAVFSAASFAGEKGQTGLKLNVSVSGFFSPEIVDAIVESVAANSPADKSGIKTGDELIAIDGCKIPGCPANEGQQLVDRKAGQILPLTLRRSDGSEYAVKLLLE